MFYSRTRRYVSYVRHIHLRIPYLHGLTCIIIGLAHDVGHEYTLYIYQEETKKM